MLSRIRVPHTLVLLSGMLVLAWILTWLIPAGNFETQPNKDGKPIVVPGTFTYATEQPRLTPWVILTSIPRGLDNAKDVVFFVLLIGGVIGLLRKSGAIEAAIGLVLTYFSHHVTLLLVVSILLFGVFSSTFGMAEEYLAFVGILVAMCVALKLDAITAVGVMIVGYGIGYGCAIINPFTVVIAQNIAGLETGSGWWFRLLMTPAFVLIGIHHVWSYSRKIQRDPTRSLVADLPRKQHHNVADFPPMTATRALILFAMAATIYLLIVGVLRWHWYLTELSALFLAFGLFVLVISRIKFDEAAQTFVAGAAELTGTALLIGFAGGIKVILEDGQVLHTIVHGLTSVLTLLPAELSAVGMLAIQYLLNFFIPSGSGQAYVTMPIMAPVGEMVGVGRQVAVLAFQFGDGFTNMVVPTNPVLMGILGLAGVPYDRWFRFVWPLMIKLFIAAAIVLVVAVRLGL